MYRSITLLVAFLCAGILRAEEISADVVVYGGTPSGIAAALQTSRMGKSVVLLEPGKWIGGVMTGGLGASDKGVTWTVGGLARDYFENIYTYYQNPAVWKSETREQYLPKHGQTHTEAMKCQWYFEPHVARAVFDQMLAKAKVPVRLNERLDRKNGVKKANGVITEITMESGLKVKGKYFIDATYEGDLMAAAGVEYFVGREANAKYGELLNGIQYKTVMARLDPYVKSGDPSSGLLPHIEPRAPGAEGEASPNIQAYNFRMCLTTNPDNMAPITKPEGYNPLEYELLLRNIVTKKNFNPKKGYFTRVPMPNLKTDSNNTGPLSTDFVGGNYRWPDGSYAEREQILKDHRAYVQGFFWFLGNDPRVPEGMRQEVSRYGLAKDEFTDNGNWPTQLYVREARRMVGDFVMAEKNFPRKFKENGKMTAHPAAEPIKDPVAIGSYALDSHVVGRFATDKGGVVAEGGIYTGVEPYPISYRVLLPKASQCKNLLVPVCMSASHVAYGSLRMEAVFMELGQAAATAACLSLEKNTTPHELPYADLRKRLQADHAVLSDQKPKNVAAEPEPDSDTKPED